MAQERARFVYTIAAMVAAVLFLLGSFLATGNAGVRIVLVAAFLAVALGGIYALLILKRAQRLERTNGQLTSDLAVAVERESDLRVQIGYLLREPLTSIVSDADLLISNPDTPADERYTLLAAIRRNARDVEEVLDELSHDGAPSVPTPEIQAVVILDDEVRSLMASDPHFQTATLDCEPARAWGDPAKVRQILRTLVTLSTQDGGAQLTVQTVQRGHTATVTVSGKGAILPDHALAALSDAPTDEHGANGPSNRPDSTDSDGRYEALRATRNLVSGMGGSISLVQAFGNSHIVLTLPAPAHRMNKVGSATVSPARTG